jgi:hypothetical protein
MIEIINMPAEEEIVIEAVKNDVILLSNVDYYYLNIKYYN